MLSSPSLQVIYDSCYPHLILYGDNNSCSPKLLSPPFLQFINDSYYPQLILYGANNSCSPQFIDNPIGYIITFLVGY
jgi:hypothetical protein